MKGIVVVSDEGAISPADKQRLEDNHYLVVVVKGSVTVFYEPPQAKEKV